MSTCNYTTLINDTDCIGDSRIVINTNFTNLDNALCNVYNPFVGMVVAFPSTIAPTGFLKLNGATINRTTYSNLWNFALSSGNLATTETEKSLSAWGKFGPGDGANTYTLPDLRGEFIRGYDDGRGIDLSRLIGTWQVDMFKSHIHRLFSYSLNNSPDGAVPVEPLLTENYIYNTWGGLQIEATGGVETRPRNISLLYCIKY